MIKEKLFPETSLFKVFEEKIETLSLEQMNDPDNTIKSIFSSVYQDSEHSRNIHRLIVEKKINLLVDPVAQKFQSHRNKLWKQKIETIFSTVLKIRELELEKLFPNVEEVVKKSRKKQRDYFFSRIQVISKIKFHEKSYQKIKQLLGQDHIWLTKPENIEPLTISLLFIKYFPQLSIPVKIEYSWEDKERSFKSYGYEQVNRTLFGDSHSLIPRSIRVGNKELTSSTDEKKDLFFLKLIEKISDLLSKNDVEPQVPKDQIENLFMTLKDPKSSVKHNFFSVIPILLQGINFNAFSPAILWLKETYPSWNANLCNEKNLKSEMDRDYGTHFEVISPKKGEVTVRQKRRFLIKNSAGRLFGAYVCQWDLKLEKNWSGILKIDSIDCDPRLSGEELHEFRKIFG